MYSLRKTVNFEAAHFLPNHGGKCKNLHGHRWEVTVEIESMFLDDMDMVFDFTKINRIVRDEYDHTCLNDKIGNPTAENLAQVIWESVMKELDKEIHTGLSIVVVETPGSEIRYSREVAWSDR